MYFHYSMHWFAHLPSLLLTESMIWSVLKFKISPTNKWFYTVVMENRFSTRSFGRFWVSESLWVNFEKKKTYFEHGNCISIREEFSLIETHVKIAHDQIHFFKTRQISSILIPDERASLWMVYTTILTIKHQNHIHISTLTGKKCNFQHMNWTLQRKPPHNSSRVFTMTGFSNPCILTRVT